MRTSGCTDVIQTIQLVCQNSLSGCTASGCTDVIQTSVQPVFVSQKIEEDLKLREAKPLIVNQQCLVYKFQCDLCDAGYVGFTRRHLH